MKIGIVGGHLAPALAVIESLPKGTECIFFGRKFTFENDLMPSLEYQEITSLGIPFFPINTGRLKREFTKDTITSSIKLPGAVFEALKILKKQRPDVVVSFGGYVSVPIGIAAIVLNIPLILHEQTMQAGVANKLLSLFAKKICISWESSLAFFPQKKTVLTGNPIRKDVFMPQKTFPLPKRNGEKVLYVTGGSTGSHAINILIEGIIEKLLENFIVIHQTGDAAEFHDYRRLQLLRDSFPHEKKERYILKKFIPKNEIGDVLHKADLVISRSGINTVSELLYLMKPAILIPLPSGQKNEQLINAKFLEKTGLATILIQEKATPEILLQAIETRASKKDSVVIIDKHVLGLVSQDGAKNIVEEVFHAAQ